MTSELKRLFAAFERSTAAAWVADCSHCEEDRVKALWNTQAKARKELIEAIEKLEIDLGRSI